MKFHLQSVLLMALDVVKGPYLSCFAPVNPVEQGGDDQPRDVQGDVNKDSSRNKDMLHLPTNAGRFKAFSDVFVPKSEFCRRVMCLVEAESGILYLFYPEEISGVHYERKTLRYTLCFAFAVDTNLVTATAATVERLLRPYSFVLTRIVEGLREAEQRSGYMSRGLSHRLSTHCPSRGDCQQQQSKNDLVGQPSRSDFHEYGGGVSAEIHSVVGTTSFASPPTGDEALFRYAKGTSRVNVFLTPPQDSSGMQWTSLEALMGELFTFLGTDPKEGETKCPRPWATENTVSLRLCETFFIPVGHRAPPHLPQQHALDEVPVPVAAYEPEVFEHVDLVMHDVFRIVDGRRTIRQIVQVLAAECERYEDSDELLQRQGRIFSPASSQCAIHSVFAHSLHPVNFPGSRSAPEVGGLASSTASTNAHPRDALNTQRATPGLLSPPSAADICLTSPFPNTVCSGTCFSAPTVCTWSRTLQTSRYLPERQNAEEAANNSISDKLSVWCELELLVVEALQHLEVHNYVKIIRPIKMKYTYFATNALYSIMSDRSSPARQLLGKRMLLVEYMFHKEKGQRTSLQGSSGNQKRLQELAPEYRKNLEGLNSATRLTPPLAPLSAHDKGVAVDDEISREQQYHIKRERSSDTALPCSTSLRHSSTECLQDGDSSHDDVDVTPAAETNPDRHEATYTEVLINMAAAAALCALGKFSGSTIFSVQRDMQGHPQWSNAFANWEESCCKSLVEIAIINGWLVAQ
ncbi:Nitrogen permease regulator 2, putative [Trypanosoma equiperdum]|uniref:Nitrogen permease regulator 2, putative n=1 Tax=Trypanosoma equiperdum TaxID=5694 RepID=A0A1G4IH07_TRYEQ|nr:Nitrogen permease regulator 2, putative [Trypanosoma equiperdum]